MTRWVWIVASVLVGGAIVFPSLGILFRLELTGRFRAEERTPFEPTRGRRTFKSGPLTRASVHFLIAGLGLLTLADAAWEHAIGVLCLLGVIVVAFLAIVPRSLVDQPPRVG